MLPVPRRSFEPEIMDRPDNAEIDLQEALRDIRRVNRFLGGRKALLRALRPLLLATDAEPLEILDVGTGDGDLPVAMQRFAGSLGRAVRVTGIDRDPSTARIARQRTASLEGIEILQADAFRPPFPPRSFDIVTASLLLHHLTHEEAVRLLRTLESLARVAVLVNDLRRHWIPWCFIRAYARILGCHPMFVHDAPLSVLRGFTVDELRRVARDAGDERAEIRRYWPYRLVLVLRCGAEA